MSPLRRVVGPEGARRYRTWGRGSGGRARYVEADILPHGDAGMNPLPFASTDLAFVSGFQDGLADLLNVVLNYIAPALSAVLVIWIIVQGILVMRGDLDARRGITQIIRVVLVYGLVSGSTLYTEIVQQWFLQSVPTWIAGLTVSNKGALPTTLPITLDLVLAYMQAALESIAALIPTDNNQDASSVAMAKLVLYGTLWTLFALYEAANLVTSVLVALGPLFIIGYLFESTKQVTQRWVGQLIYYAILFLLVNVVATIVIAVDLKYVTAELAALVVAQALSPVAGQINDIWDLDIFLLTGDFIVICMPGAAAAISGGYATGRGETNFGGLGGARSPFGSRGGSVGPGDSVARAG